ncbi:MAG: hypothetical protein K6C12_05950 [Oscillospiraceae bacterium]|nr:hypothetical protein [Oscillospiraceae bacterium]
MMVEKVAKRKISNQWGETIAETLVALLISAVALVMLASMISSSSSVITRARDRLSSYYDNMELMNRETTSTANEYVYGSSNLSVQDLDSSASDKIVFKDAKIPVNYYGNTAFSKTQVVTYRYAEGSGGGGSNGG